MTYKSTNQDTCPPTPFNIASNDIVYGLRSCSKFGKSQQCISNYHTCSWNVLTEFDAYTLTANNAIKFDFGSDYHRLVICNFKNSRTHPY